MKVVTNRRRAEVIFLLVSIVIGLFLISGCGGTKVSYGTKVVCKSCSKVVKDNTKTKVVPTNDAYKWRVKIVKGLCKKCKKKREERARRKKKEEEELLRILAQLKAKSAGQALPKTTLDGTTTVRVGVFSTTASIQISANGSFKICDGSGRTLGNLGKGEIVNVSYTGGRYRASCQRLSLFSATPLKFASSGAIIQVLSLPQYNQFKGVVEVCYSPYSRVLWAVNELSLKDYLNGIGEEPEKWSGMSANAYQEFLRAAVVAIRTYTLAVKQEGKHNKREAFDVCSFTSYQHYGGCCQLYIGYIRETHGGNLKRAIEETAGQVITYNGQIIRAAYSSGCDGRTRSWQEVWGGASKPWAVSVPCPNCVGQKKAAHGVGLCMRGARSMAARGIGYKEILAYYYRGTRVEAK